MDGDGDQSEWEINPIKFLETITTKKDLDSIENLLTLVKDISEEEIADIGNFVLKCIVENDRYISLFNLREDEKIYKQIIFKESFTEIIVKTSMNSIFLPMICRPVLWDGRKVGGFITEDFRSIAFPNDSFVKKQPKLINESEISEKHTDTINYMNNVPFKINNNVLYFVLKEWEKDDSIIFKNYNKLHSRTKEINTKCSKALFKEIQAHNSKYFHYYNTIFQATLYKDISFYLPTFLDFRGRIYTKCSYLTYQGVDLARGLLEFDATISDSAVVVPKDEKVKNSEGLNVKVTDTKEYFDPEIFRYVKHYAGNVYNLSKKTIKEKIK